MQFRILGPVEVRAAGRGFPVGQPRQQAVLAVLLVDAGRTVPVDALVDRIFGALVTFGYSRFSLADLREPLSSLLVVVCRRHVGKMLGC